MSTGIAFFARILHAVSAQAQTPLVTTFIINPVTFAGTYLLVPSAYLAVRADASRVAILTGVHAAVPARPVAVFVASIRWDLISVIALLSALNESIAALFASTILVTTVAVPLVAIITLFAQVLFRESISAPSFLLARRAARCVEIWKARNL